MSKYLTRDEILQAQDLPQEKVDVPEWGGEVLVRGLTGAERDAFEGDMVRPNGNTLTLDLEGAMQNVRARLVARTIVDENGKRQFSDDDIAALGRKSAKALQRVFEVAQRLSGMTNKDVQELGTALKNAPSADLPTG